jgi:hypothetical protein
MRCIWVGSHEHRFAYGLPVSGKQSGKQMVSANSFRLGFQRLWQGPLTIPYLRQEGVADA